MRSDYIIILAFTHVEEGTSLESAPEKRTRVSLVFGESPAQ